MSTEPHPILKTLRIIWFAMIMSQAIFVFVAFFVAANNEAGPPDPEEFRVITLAISAFSFTTVPLALLARRFMMGRSEATPDRIPGLYQTSSIVGWALAESVTINGFVLAFLSMEPRMIIPFVIGGLGCTIVTIPRAQQLTDYIHAARKRSVDDGPEGASW
jgi:F0F1-type ATP synthase membrane subunit c/vacuolar-type H+-ATPase subunit K